VYIAHFIPIEPTVPPSQFHFHSEMRNTFFPQNEFLSVLIQIESAERRIL
jgi:hypothetical protein